MKRWLAALLLVSAVPAGAGAASDAFAAGRYAEAARLGAGARTVEDRVAAARGASTLAVYEARDKAEAKALLDEALGHANAAAGLAPASLDAQLQQAIIIGYRAKLDRSPGGARQSRRAIDAVLAKAPTDALANAVLGGWHGEAIATLGGFVAGTVLGAKKGEFVRHFDRALAAEPASVVYPTFYAFTLLNLGADNAGKARELLARADRGRPQDAYEALIQGHARRVLKPLAAGDVKTARALTAQLSPLGRIG
jgi:hypothetical protein